MCPATGCWDSAATTAPRRGSCASAVLEAAAAEERTRTGAQVEHRATIDAKVVSYSAGLHEAYDALKFGVRPCHPDARRPGSGRRDRRDASALRGGRCG